MISLEQVQLLETRVSKAVDYVQKVKAENAALKLERETLLKKIETNQKRIDELEVHIMRFKDDQSRIEDGIIAALDRLSQFEEAFESTLKDSVKSGSPVSKKSQAKSKQEDKPDLRRQPEARLPDTSAAEPAANKIFFEIPGKDTADNEEPDDDLSSEAELDIF